MLKKMIEEKILNLKFHSYVMKGKQVSSGVIGTANCCVAILYGGDFMDFKLQCFSVNWKCWVSSNGVMFPKFHNM